MAGAEQACGIPQFGGRCHAVAVHATVRTSISRGPGCLSCTPQVQQYRVSWARTQFPFQSQTGWLRVHVGQPGNEVLKFMQWHRPHAGLVFLIVLLNSPVNSCPQLQPVPILTARHLTCCTLSCRRRPHSPCQSRPSRAHRQCRLFSSAFPHGRCRDLPESPPDGFVYRSGHAVP